MRPACDGLRWCQVPYSRSRPPRCDDVRDANTLAFPVVLRRVRLVVRACGQFVDDEEIPAHAAGAVDGSADHVGADRRGGELEQADEYQVVTSIALCSRRAVPVRISSSPRTCGLVAECIRESRSGKRSRPTPAATLRSAPLMRQMPARTSATVAAVTACSWGRSGRH